ncbi:MAG TPA: beta-ketoacyl-[acyl-carrier-protein] synthase II [Anaerolineae bacterium]|nr:beta-ketoacyl-[acyl-carrier-protein] synthase II [Anaerolineae bacterium]
MTLESPSRDQVLDLIKRLQDAPAAVRELILETLKALEKPTRSPAAVAEELLAKTKDLSVDTLEQALHLAREGLRRRVVVTGLGAITAVGKNVTEMWDNLVAGRSGIDYATLIDPSPYPTRIAAEVKDWDPSVYLPRKEARRMARCSQFAVGMAHQALEDAGLPTDGSLGDRTATVIGTGLGGFEVYQQAITDATKRGRYRISPMVAVGGLPNMPAFHISQRFGAMGPLNTVVTACAAGTQAVGEGAELIRRGFADVVIAGGVEALVTDMFFASFSSMKALSTRNDPPEKASRPFDANRDGFIIGEGGAVLILEDLDHALARGARIYAEVIGHAASADAYHVAAPHPEGLGAQNAMRWAIEDAGIRPEDVDYINAHGTSTRLNDKTETYAIKKLFGEHAYNLAVNSTKSMIGHAFGGAGAIEAVVSVLSVFHDLLHPTINYETPDPECDLDYVPNQARKQRVNIALSNSFGLGGQNACLVVKKFTG